MLYANNMELVCVLAGNSVSKEALGECHMGVPGAFLRMCLRDCVRVLVCVFVRAYACVSCMCMCMCVHEVCTGCAYARLIMPERLVLHLKLTGKHYQIVC